MPATKKQEEPTVYFGEDIVSPSEKQQRVRGVFDAVANRYDLMNDLMSAGLHRLWKEKLINALAPAPGRNYLDVAGGTGDVAFRIQDRLARRHANRPDAPSSSVTVCDINAAMLTQGKAREIDQLRLRHQTYAPLAWRCGNAEALPFETASFDGYTIAFGLRNVSNFSNALSEAYRVLKPGGHFLCLEFSPAVHPAFAKLYDTFSYRVIPPLGKLVTGDAAPYQYLVESIRKFPEPQALSTLMEQVGFAKIRATPVSAGVVYMHSGWKL